MTDTAKALAFARECLGWNDPTTDGHYVWPLPTIDRRRLIVENPLPSVETFLCKRFFIQIARGTTSLFKWSVIVGLQDRAGTPATTFDHGCAEGDDMWDAVFDACVAAARLYPIG